jgi:ribonuclease G
VISISGGAPFVGEKKLVRIDEVKRTAAYASLLSDNGGPADEEAGDDTASEDAAAEPEGDEEAPAEANGERVQSNGSTSKRRRGRRGGRRRSRAKTHEGSGSASS